MNDNFDRISHRPTPDSLDKPAAWAATQERFAAGPAAAGTGRPTGAKLIGGLAAAAAVVAAGGLVFAAAQPRPAAEPPISPSAAPSEATALAPSPQAEPEPTDAPGVNQYPDLSAPAADCGSATAAAELTAADAQTMMQCALAAMAAPDLVVSAETLGQEGRDFMDERMTAPAAGGLLLVNQRSIDGTGGPEDLLFVLKEDGVPRSLRLLHNGRLYEDSDPEEYGNGVDYLDPEGLGWMGQLIDHWDTAKALLAAASDPTAEAAITVLGADQQDGRDVVKLELAGGLLPAAYQANFAASAEFWLYLDDGMPARAVFTFDLAPIHDDWVANQDGELAVDFALVGWCWEEARAADNPVGTCAERPVVYRWARSADPASILTLAIPEGYEPLPQEEEGWTVPAGDEDCLIVEIPEGAADPQEYADRAWQQVEEVGGEVPLCEVWVVVNPDGTISE
ncbi:MAG: hypothetical protein LBD90_02965 [Bifidobacteriaceae bacterium]|jgi:hypothetical protein|nr:hypothetical protein [Bifidobacteriaceae bacterium]